MSDNGTTKGKVVLFAPRPSMDYWGGEPWSLLAVSRYLVPAGYDVVILQSFKGEDFRADIKRHARGALLFGVSCMTGYAIHEALEASRVFREANPEGRVVWGGWHPSIMPEQVAGAPEVDFAVSAQGERTILELADAVREGRGPDGIEGVTFVREGRTVKNPPRTFEDVNNFPPMPYEILDLSRNLTLTDLGNRTLRYVSSQGCPHRCGFCVEPVVFGRRWFGLDPERVVDEIEGLVKSYNIDSLIFTDSNFFVDKKRVKRIAELFIERGLNLSWGNANGRTRQLLRLGDDTWETLKKSGLKSVLIGAESGIQEGLDLINKDTTVEETLELAELCGRYGIKITFSLMIGLPYDLPEGMTREDLVRKEYDSIIGLLDKVYRTQKIPNLFLLFVYTPYPGTPLYGRSIELGMPEPATLEDWSVFELVADNTPWVPAKYSERARMLTEYIFRWLDDLYFSKLKNKRSPLRPLYVVGGYMFTALSRLRWRFKFFGLPLDYLAFKFALRHMKGGTSN